MNKLEKLKNQNRVRMARYRKKHPNKQKEYRKKTQKKVLELSNCAGKIIQSLKVELEYNSLLGLKKEIKYLK